MGGGAGLTFQLVCGAENPPVLAASPVPSNHGSTYICATTHVWNSLQGNFADVSSLQPSVFAASCCRIVGFSWNIINITTFSILSGIAMASPNVRSDVHNTTLAQDTTHDWNGWICSCTECEPSCWCCTTEVSNMIPIFVSYSFPTRVYMKSLFSNGLIKLKRLWGRKQAPRCSFLLTLSGNCRRCPRRRGSTLIKMVFAPFQITWLLWKREGPLLASSGTAFSKAPIVWPPLWYNASAFHRFNGTCRHSSQGLSIWDRGCF